MICMADNFGPTSVSRVAATPWTRRCCMRSGRLRDSRTRDEPVLNSGRLLVFLVRLKKKIRHLLRHVV